MTPEEQRIAIAEACGYTFKDERGRFPEDHDWEKYKAVYRGEGFIGLARTQWIPVPDYLNDLNAMHVAELAIVNDNYRWSLYTKTHLPRLCENPIRANAAQRAEAFLKTIGKWKES